MREVLFDNMKTAFLADAEGLFHPNLRLLSFAHHYGFLPKRCRVRRPDQGQGGAADRHLAGNFLPQVSGQDLGLDELNERVRCWLSEVGEVELRDYTAPRTFRSTHKTGMMGGRG